MKLLGVRIVPAAMAALLLTIAIPCPRAEGQSWAEFGNRYLKVLIGTGGTVDTDLGDGLDVNGRWAVVTGEGDPDTPGDNNRALTYAGLIAPCGNFGFWKLRIAGQDFVIGDSSSGGWRNLNGIDETPRAFAYPPIDPKTGGQGRAGGYIRGVWRTNVAANAPVDVLIKASLVRDLVRFELTIQNNTNVTQSIGFAMQGDVEVTDSITVAYPFIPGVGFTRSLFYPDRFIAMLFGAPGTTKVPDYFDIYDDIAYPTLVARNVLGLEDATKPDYVAIGDYYDLASTAIWLPSGAYQPNTTVPVSDFYWVLNWAQKNLGPGATRKIVTYYGIGVASSKWTYGTKKEQDHVVLAVQGPRSLKFDTTRGAATTLYPTPFTVRAYVYNLDVDFGPYDLQDVTATITLPRGLTLAPGETRAKSIGAVPKNFEADPVSWNIQATGEVTGELEYFVSAVDTTGWQQTVARKILVPADKQKVFNYGWQLVSVPFQFSDPQVAHVFNITLGTFGAKEWRPLESPAAGNSYYPVAQVRPGKGFWMALSDITGFTQTLALPLASDARIAGESMGKQIFEQYVDVYPGWNMIGNPFVYPIYWGQVLVYDSDLNRTVTLDEAADRRRWIRRTLFAWNPAKFAYDNVTYNDQLLIPYQGYWLYVLSPSKKTLIFRPALFPESDVTTFVGGL